MLDIKLVTKMGIIGDFGKQLRNLVSRKTPDQLLIERFENFVAAHSTKEGKIKPDELTDAARAELDGLKSEIATRANAIYLEEARMFAERQEKVPRNPGTLREMDVEARNQNRVEVVKVMNPDIDESKLELLGLFGNMDQIIEPEQKLEEIPLAKVASIKEVYGKELDGIVKRLNEDLKDFGVTAEVRGDRLYFTSDIDKATPIIRDHYQKLTPKGVKPERILLEDTLETLKVLAPEEIGRANANMGIAANVAGIPLNKEVIDGMLKSLDGALENINDKKADIIEKSKPKQLRGDEARVERVSLEVVIAQLNNVTSEVGGNWRQDGNRLQMDINEIPGGAARAIITEAKERDTSPQSIAAGIVYDALRSNNVNVANEEGRLSISLRNDGAYAAFGNSSKIKGAIGDKIKELNEKIIDDQTIRVEEPRGAASEPVDEIVTRLNNVLNKVGFGAQQVEDRVIITIPDKQTENDNFLLLRKAAKVLAKGGESRTGLILDEVNEGLMEAGINSRRVDEDGARGIVIDASDLSKVEEKLSDKGLKVAVQGRLQNFIERGRAEDKARRLEA